MIRMRWMWGFAPAVLAMGLGCSNATPQAASPESASVAPAGTSAPAATDEDDEASSEDLREHHRHHHHGGFAMFIAMSLESLGATPEQSAAITKIREDMHAKMMPAHEAEKNVLLTLADGAQAGTIDKAKVDAAIAQLSTAAAGVHDAVADSLNQLHAVLTPPQRAALIDKLEAHFEVWHKANLPDEAAENDAHGGHLGKAAKELGLTPDQIEKVRASFKASMGSAPHFDEAEAQAHMKAFGAAFASDTFDAKKLTTGGPANAHMATWGVTRMAHFYEAVLPMLTPENRTKLADSLRRHANYKRTESGT